jgi:DedD protein
MASRPAPAGRGRVTRSGGQVEEPLKRRLVGAFVLVSLAVIFLPMLLEEQSPEVHIGGSNIPPPPATLQGADFQSSVTPLAAAEPLIPSLVVAGETPAGVASGAGEPSFPSGSEAVRTGLTAWVVQVASLASQANAEKLAADLRGKGHSTFLEPIRTDGRTLFRVRVGPEADRSRADRVLEDIRHQFGIQGQVVRYP